MARAEHARRFRWKALTDGKERCHGQSFRDGQTMKAWFVPPIVVPLFLVIVMAVVLVMRWLG
jgi:hypothetical protein